MTAAEQPAPWVELGRELGVMPMVGQSLKADVPRRVREVHGVAGGVGTSTVAGLINGHDAGMWAAEQWAQRRAELLVARTTGDSIARAETIIAQQLAPLACRPILVLISDGHGRPGADSRARLTMLHTLTAAIIELPYVAAWRDKADPLSVTPGMDWFRELNKLYAALGMPASDTLTTKRRRRPARGKTK